MSTYKTINAAIKEIEYWLRLATFMHHPLKQALLNVLHNTSNNPSYIGLPRDPTDLYRELSTKHYATIQRLVAKKVLQKDQLELLLPPNKTSTDSQQFDITLITLLIANCTTLPAPVNGWRSKDKPLDTDLSIAADAVRGRKWRNYVHHTDPADIDEATFNTKWDEGVRIVNRLGLICDTNKLKTMSLDPKHDGVLASLLTFMNKLKSDQRKHDSEFTAVKQTTKNLETNNNKLIDRVDTIAKEIAILKNPGIMLNDKIDEKETCCSDVTQLISNHQNYEIITQHLLAKKNDGIADEDKSNIADVIDKMPWVALKLSLEMVGQESVVTELQEKTLLTKGIRNASIKLRQYYIKELINCLVEQPLSSSSDQSSYYMPRKDVYIELAVLQASFIDSEVNNSDRDALLKLNYLNRTSLSIDDLFQDEDQLVFIRGVAGIGKSTLLTMYTLKWAKGELDNQDTTSPISFIFLFTCRELNMYTNEASSLSLEQLFKDKYSEVFEHITLEDLQKVSSQILIIIDGLDELQDIYLMDDGNVDGKKKSTSSFACNLKMVLDMIDIKGNFLKNHKSIVCGRPKSCEFIKSRFLQKYTIKTVEVCGFSDKNVLRFIDNFFSEEKDVTKADNVKKQVTKSSNLKVMSSVPVFLWVICNVYGENLITNPISTNTELYLYACLVFLRNHLHGLSSTSVHNHGSYQHLVDIIQDTELLKSLFELMTLSVKTYMNDQILFTDKDIEGIHCSLHLEQTGFIVKISRGNLQKSIYQFRHLVLQEFLCGLYLCVTKLISPFRSNKELRSCFPTIVGIQRMCKEQNNELFLELFSNLCLIYEEQLPSNIVSKSMSSIRNLTFKKYIKDHLLKAPKSMVKGNTLLIDGSSSDCMNFLATYFEGVPTKDFNSTKTCNIINLYSSTEVRNALHLVKTLEIPVTALSIRCTRFSQDCVDLIKLCVIQNEDFKLDIVIANSYNNEHTAIYCTEGQLYLYLARTPEDGKFCLPEEIKELASKISIHLPAIANYFIDLVELEELLRSVEEFVLQQNDGSKHLHINDGPYSSLAKAVERRKNIPSHMVDRIKAHDCMTIRDCGEFSGSSRIHWIETLFAITQSYYLEGVSREELRKFLPSSEVFPKKHKSFRHNEKNLYDEKKIYRH